MASSSEASIGQTAPIANQRAGWLMKRGAINRAFRRRWCVLQDSILTYHVQESGPAKGHIKIKGAAVEAGQGCRLFVSLAMRTYVLEAPSSSERDEWVKAIKSAGATLLVRRHETAPHGRALVPGRKGVTTVTIQRQTREATSPSSGLAPPPMLAMRSSSKCALVQQERAAKAAREIMAHASSSPQVLQADATPRVLPVAEFILRGRRASSRSSDAGAASLNRLRVHLHMGIRPRPASDQRSPAPRHASIGSPAPRHKSVGSPAPRYASVPGRHRPASVAEHEGV